MGFTKTENQFSPKRMTRAEAAYVAGVIDGEGTIGLRAKHRRGGKSHQFNPALRVSNTSLSLLEALIRMTGNGQIFADRRGTGQRACYDWALSANQIRHVLPQVAPHLVVKQRQSELLLRFLELVHYPVGAKTEDIPEILAIREELGQLNRRGVRADEEQQLSLKEPRCTEQGCSRQSYRGHPWCYQHWQLQREVQQAACEECGGPMIVADKRKRFCSARCQQKHWYRTVDKPNAQAEQVRRPPGICKNCGISFDRSAYARKTFCNPRCRDSWNNRHRQSRARLPATPDREAFDQRVRSLKREAGWDGEGAEAITDATCSQALELIDRILEMSGDLPLPFAAPSAYGAVSLRWASGAKDLALYAFADGRLEIYSQQAGGRYMTRPVEPQEAIDQLLAFKPEPRIERDSKRE